jgi:hypothetical protein
MNGLCCWWRSFAIILIGLFFACAVLPTLDVTYKAPPRARTLEGRQIYFEVIDTRANKDVIGPGAKGIYKDFAGNIALIVERWPEEKSRPRIYEVKSLFQNTVTMYLENMGVTLLPEPKKGSPHLVLNIHDFILDLHGSRWTARIVYKAEFYRAGKVMIREFRGEGEKLRISGLAQAHQVMSETFTDIINKLDVAEFFSSI